MVHEFCSDKNNQGGGVAAPLGGQILNEVLPYIGITPKVEEEQFFVFLIYKIKFIFL